MQNPILHRFKCIFGICDIIDGANTNLEEYSEKARIEINALAEQKIDPRRKREGTVLSMYYKEHFTFIMCILQKLYYLKKQSSKHKNQF